MGVFSDMVFRPLDMLGSTLAVRTPIDSEYGEEYAEPVTIGNVRFVESQELQGTIMGGEASGHTVTSGPHGTIYIDANTSTGAFEVPVRSVVSVDGSDEMQVTACKTFRDFGGRLHHWELEVG